MGWGGVGWGGGRTVSCVRAHAFIVLLRDLLGGGREREARGGGGRRRTRLGGAVEAGVAAALSLQSFLFTPTRDKNPAPKPAPPHAAHTPSRGTSSTS